MFRYQRSLLKLTSTKSSHIVKPLTSTVRFNSSSVKVQPNTTTTSTTTTATVDKEKALNASTKSKEQLELEANNKNKIPFMPVINIPETEFAHNAFFSLYRPLLGLSDEDETPFFSKKPVQSEEERNQEKLDIFLSVYMSNCTPFVDPSQLSIKKQGGDFTEEGLFDDTDLYDNAVESSSDSKTDVLIKITEEEYQNFQDLFGEDDDLSVSQQQQPAIEQIEENRQQHQLPMFHMPESADVLDYLTTVESNMKQEHAKLDAEDKLKDLRLKKMEILSGVSNRNSRPRFYAANRNVSQKLRRYQQKWMLKKE